jgi:hypothetical protein
MTFQEIQMLLAQGFTPAMIASMSGAPTAAPVAAPVAVKLKGFVAHQEAKEACRLCGHNLGSPDCCGMPAPAMIFKALEKAQVPLGPRRVAAVKAAKAAQKAAGLAGPAYSRECIQAALAAAGVVAAPKAVEAPKATEAPAPVTAGTWFECM